MTVRILTFACTATTGTIIPVHENALMTIVILYVMYVIIPPQYA